MEWLDIPEGQWATVGLIGTINSVDNSINFILTDEEGEVLTSCSEVKATFVKSSNKAWKKGNPTFLKGTWLGQYKCNEKSVSLTLEYFHI